MYYCIEYCLLFKLDKSPFFVLFYYSRLVYEGFISSLISGEALSLADTQAWCRHSKYNEKYSVSTKLSKGLNDSYKEGSQLVLELDKTLTSRQN